MELRHLRYFVVLAEELHFGRAARRLSISQPPLSVAIRQLEESVGARLFDRNSKEVRLTPAGQALQALGARGCCARPRRPRWRRATCAQGSAGRLRIGFVGAMLYRGLPQALASFQATHPAVRVTLAELNSGEQITELLHDRWTSASSTPAACRPSCGTSCCCRSPSSPACRSAHRLARRRTVAVREPARRALRAVLAQASPDYHERILAICADAGFRPEVRHEVRHWLSVVSLVSQGMGVALVPSAMRHAALRGAVFRPLEEDGGRLGCLLRLARAGPTTRWCRAFFAPCGPACRPPTQA